MRKSSCLSDEQAKPANEAQSGPEEIKKRSDNRITTIAIIDNGTMVEAFKFLNYCQLAKNSLVSNKFRKLIQIHRHSLALLYVDSLVMTNFPTTYPLIRIFDKVLSAEEYNKWVIRNGYSKEIPINCQIAGEQSAQYDPKVYALWANRFYKDPNSGQSSGSSFVFYAQTKLNDNHWPLFQHFVRLLMDPFVSICSIKLILQTDVLNLLAGATDPDCGRLRCGKLKFNLDGNVQKFKNWMKNHLCCDEFIIVSDTTSNYDVELLDLLVTGAHCTSAIDIGYYDSSKVIVEFIQKFMDLKSSDECQVVESIQGKINYEDIVELLKSDLAEFVVKEKMDEGDDITEFNFEFINNDVRKKLQLTIEILDIDDEFVLTINNL